MNWTYDKMFMLQQVLIDCTVTMLANCTCNDKLQSGVSLKGGNPTTFLPAPSLPSHTTENCQFMLKLALPGFNARWTCFNTSNFHSYSHISPFTGRHLCNPVLSFAIATAPSQLTTADSTGVTINVWGITSVVGTEVTAQMISFRMRKYCQQ